MKKSYTIKEVSTLFQVPASTLRFWERKGLIKPNYNKSNSYREYSLQTIFEISDIILYRSLDFSIDELKGLSKLNSDELASTMEKAENKVDNQINHLFKLKNKIKNFKGKFEEYEKLNKSPYTVSYPNIGKIIPFIDDDKTSMQLYTKNHYDYVFTTHSKNPNIITGGLSVEADFPSEKVIWIDPKKEEKYIECLITAENGNSSNNDLSCHIEYIKNQGYTTNLILAKFLFSGISDKDGQHYDYYHGWIKID